MTEQRKPVPKWAELSLQFSDRFIYVAPGKKVMQFYHIINAQKFTVIAYIFALMSYYDNFSTGAWVYLALHGIYGYCWLIKDFAFRDHTLEHPASWQTFFRLHLLLSPYLILPWLFISRHVEPSGFEMFVAISVHTLGIAFMIGGDGQRHFTLLHKKGLIKTGMFRYTRNPNYFGEILIYMPYAYLADHWIGYAICAYQIFGLFLPRMLRKDYSISRHPGWKEYEATSSLLIPWALINGRAIRDLFRQNDATKSQVSAKS